MKNWCFRPWKIVDYLALPKTDAHRTKTIDRIIHSPHLSLQVVSCEARRNLALLNYSVGFACGLRAFHPELVLLLGVRFLVLLRHFLQFASSSASAVYWTASAQQRQTNVSALFASPTILFFTPAFGQSQRTLSLDYASQRTTWDCWGWPSWTASSCFVQLVSKEAVRQLL